MVPICDTPSEVRGMWWGVLERGQCLQGDIQYWGDYRNTGYKYIPIEGINKDTNADINKKHVFHAPLHAAAEQYVLSVSAVLFIIGAIGNVMIIIITCSKELRSVPNMYILTLAVSDIIYLMVLFLGVLRYGISITWLRGEISCKFIAFCDRMSVGLTAYCVAVISFQRYRVIVNPLHVHASSQPTWRNTGVIICGLWIVAALFAIPAALSTLLCRFSELLWLKSYYLCLALFHLSVSCVFPLCVIAFSYIMTARHLLKRADSLFADTQNPQLNTRTNTAKVVLALIVIFLISYVPHHIWVVYFFFSVNAQNFADEWDVGFGRDANSFDIMPILKLLLSINSCLNPVALFCTSHAFRRQFKRYLICCCETKSPSNEFELTKRN
jgi:hypothetical protein